MRYICDFHIHSKYSRATSKEIDIDNLAKWAKIKGVNVLSTSDFTHPLWLREIKEKLVLAEDGLFKLKHDNGNHNGNHNETRFILTTEISSIYSKNGKTRKIHNIVFAPSLDAVEKINTHLGWIGNLKSDGRPILGLDAKELAKIVLGISPECMIVPAHAWTPWFSIFGSYSGFDSIEECFEEYTQYIYAIETGLSSDPEMNWMLSKLDNITLISNSDAHSPAKIGREANVLEGEEISYNLIREAIMKKSDKLKLVETLEFFPEEGKYHYDGHRHCGMSFSPEESRKYNNICPCCGKPMTIGVLNRVYQLADRKLGEKPQAAIPYMRLIPLNEIIADVIGVGVSSKAVENHYKNLIRVFGSEFKILLETKKQDIGSVSLPEIGEAVERVKEGKVSVRPGYDGEFGKISIFGKNEERPKKTGGQETLF